MAGKAEVLVSYAGAAVKVGLGALAGLLAGWYLAKAEPSLVAPCSEWLPLLGITMVVWAILGVLDINTPWSDRTPAGRLNRGIFMTLSIIGVFLLFTAAVALFIRSR